MIKRLNWDSDFFEIEVGELVIDDNEKKENVINEEFDLLFVKSNKEFEQKIENYNNSFSETKVLFSKPVENHLFENQTIFSYKEKESNINEIYELAFESGKFSRFNLDSNFPKEKFRELYKKWVDNSISNIFADDLFVYLQDNEVIGFVTYKINDQTAIIGLIAVSIEHQGKGIGGKLIKYVENKLHKKNVQTLFIPTQQSNILACIFYKKLGYDIHETTFIKHFWKK